MLKGLVSSSGGGGGSGVGTVNGIVKADGSGNVSAAIPGVDYALPGGGGRPGGSPGQVQYNNGGAFGGFTVGGDGTLNTATGALSVTKTGGTAFAASATTDATNATNISSGTLAAARGGAGTVSGIMKADGAGNVSAAASGTDYAPATSGTAILKANGGGGFSGAAAGTDYIAPGGTLGTPSSGTLTNCSGLPVSTGLSGLGTNVATALGNALNAANGIASGAAFTGDSGSGGASGLVPAPAAGDAAMGKLLQAGGSWGGAFTILGSTTLGANADYIAFTNLPAVQMMKIFLKNVQHTNGSNTTFGVSSSANNGTNWSVALAVSISMANTAKFAGGFPYFPAWTDAGTSYGKGLLVIDGNILNLIPSQAGQVNGIKVLPAAGQLASGSTVILYGVL